MIDWDIKEIEKLEKHYANVLNPSINIKYFCRHFEEIYRLITDEEEILPDFLNDITFYTFNGINAKDKLLFSADYEKELAEKLYDKRMKQKFQRQKARNRGLEEYYIFIIREIEEFIERYPYWKELLQYKQ